MSIKGAWDGLSELRKQLVVATDGELKARLLKAAAAEARMQVSMQFRVSKDPYGEAWKPLKYRKGMPLRDTGRMANSFTSNPTSEGFVIGTNVEYAKFHQDGTNGHSADSMRFQPVKKNKFISKNKAGKGKRGSTELRLLNFKAGSGGIPARKMVPNGGAMSPIWLAAVNKACDVAFRNYFKKAKP